MKRHTGYNICHMIHRLLPVLIVFQLSGCVYLPLPDKAPPLQEVQLPRPGDSVAEVRRVFGEPQVLDSGRYLLYDWTTDRAFVIFPLYPSGLPGATVIAGQRFRMRVVMDDAQRVSSIECSVDKLDSRQLNELGCLDTAEMRALAGHGEWRELADIAELADVRFWHPEGAGTNTNMVLSPDGSVLAATDVKNRTWIIDLESFTLIGRSENIRPSFWSLKGVPEPRAAFTADARQLVITQGEVTSLLSRQGDQFMLEAQLNGHDLKVARFVCCPKGLMGLGSDGAFLITLGGETRGSVNEEGRLGFSVSGAAVTRQSPPGAFRVIALDSAVFSPSPRAVFGESGHENVVLDTRNDFARQRAPANFEFSPDGHWLARNSCRHLELWDSGQLSERLSDESSAMTTPARAMMMPLPSGTSYDGDCHGPIAFHPDGKMVAATSKKAIHIWRIDGGTLEIVLDVDEKGRGLHVVAIAFDTNHRLAAVVSNYRGKTYVARWTLPDSL